MYVRFVQRSNFAMRIAPRARTVSVNDTGRLASTENSRFSRGSVVPSSTPAGKTQMPCRPLSEGNPM